MAGVRNFWFDVGLFVLASPVLLILAIRRGIHRYRFFRLVMESAIVCECRSTVSLVGLWRCGCGFTYRGHLLRLCPVCSSIPCMVRCHRCGVTTKLPEAS